MTEKQNNMVVQHLISVLWSVLDRWNGTSVLDYISHK